MARKLTKKEERILDKMSNQFMQPDIKKGDWHQIDGSEGTFFFQADYFSALFAREQYPGCWDEYTLRSGFGARLSAPGYLDCTDWTVFDTYEEAARYLIETYADDEE